MRAPLLLPLVVLSVFLLTPAPGQTQIDTSQWEAEIIGSASAFKNSDESWRPAGTLRFRLIPQRFLHFEFAYTYAATRGKLLCPSLPGGPGCDAYFPESSNRLTGGLGLQAPGDTWRPFVGLGYGSNEGDPVWAWYTGLEVLPWESFGLVAEYRAGEVNSYRDHWHRTHELGVGIVWRLW
jgi:hypothetical protein